MKDNRPDETAPLSSVAGPSLDAILEGIVEGFFALDGDWRFTIFNSAAVEMFSIARADVLGKTIWEVSPRIVGGSDFSEERILQFGFLMILALLTVVLYNDLAKNLPAKWWPF